MLFLFLRYLSQKAVTEARIQNKQDVTVHRLSNSIAEDYKR